MGPGMLRIQPRYLALAALLLGTEVLIARHTHGLLRGFVGDMLVVPLVYALLRATVQWPRGLAAGAALALACLVELMQGLGLPDVLHGLLPGAAEFITTAKEKGRRAKRPALSFASWERPYGRRLLTCRCRPACRPSSGRAPPWR